MIDHRHQLVRGLRAWVASTRTHLRVRDVPDVGQDVARACAWLEVYAGDLPDETRAELDANLSAWLSRAWGMLDRAPRESGEDPHARLPMGRWHTQVRVADAAAILGCTVRTIQRRVPPAARPGGRVELYDALPRCPICDLRVGADCACTGVRTVTVVGA